VPVVVTGADQPLGRAVAEALAAEGVAIASGTDLLNLHADALMDLAEVQELAGHHARSRRSATAARDLYERKGNVVAARRAAGAAESAERHPAPAG
jgi:NAD(P)-dependent dehydrogenase (short-subunit alcohol dehydrogenase family)